MSNDKLVVGMKADLAQNVADAMGVELELVAVQSSDPMQCLVTM
jgi:hypothetical protein